MTKILIPNFTLTPDHFTFDGVKTHINELVQVLLGTSCSISMLLSVKKLSKDGGFNPLGQFLINNLSPKEWILISNAKRRVSKIRLIKSALCCRTIDFNGHNLATTLFGEWSKLDKIYMEELLKKKALTYYSCRRKLWEIKGFNTYDLCLQSYPFPIIAKHIPNVAIVHDIIPLTHPHLVASSFPKKNRLMKTILERYDRILTVSEYAKLSLLDYFDLDERKVEVVYQSVGSPHETDRDINAIPAHLGLEHQRFLLYISRLEPRKNHARLIEAYQCADVNIPLVIVGQIDAKKWMVPESIRKLVGLPVKKSPLAERVNENIIQLTDKKKIIWLNEVSSLVLAQLYRSARGLIFPSEAEGFGLPVVEAFTYGCPVAAANTTATPEIAGNAALLFNPYSVKDIANAMFDLCHDDSLCAQLSQLGFIRAAFFSRDAYQKRLMTNLSPLMM